MNDIIAEIVKIIEKLCGKFFHKTSFDIDDNDQRSQHLLRIIRTVCYALK